MTYQICLKKTRILVATDVAARGIDISGVGIVVSENKVYDVPSMGILYSGNNHLIEKNEIDINIAKTIK